MGALGIILILIILVIFYLIVLYNRLVRLRNQTDNSWHQIDVQLQKRADLVPNLVETVKGYAAHERGVFESVTQARSQWQKATTVGEKAEATNMLTGALKSLFAVAENYPELKANQNFLMLQEELAGIESKIAYARQFYNDSVMSFNNAQQTFPATLFARNFNFTPKEYFQVEETKRAVPKVDFKS
jgi:LemA protein